MVYSDRCTMTQVKTLMGIFFCCCVFAHPSPLVISLPCFYPLHGPFVIVGKSIFTFYGIEHCCILSRVCVCVFM